MFHGDKKIMGKLRDRLDRNKDKEMESIWDYLSQVGTLKDLAVLATKIDSAENKKEKTERFVEFMETWATLTKNITDDKIAACLRILLKDAVGREHLGDLVEVMFQSPPKEK